MLKPEVYNRIERIVQEEVPYSKKDKEPRHQAGLCLGNGISTRNRAAKTQFDVPQPFLGVVLHRPQTTARESATDSVRRECCGSTTASGMILTIEAPTQVRVLIADDQPAFGYGLHLLLESEPGFTVVGEVRNGSDVAALVNILEPDVLLLDLLTPRFRGAEILSQLFCTHSEVRTIVLVTAIEKKQIEEALRLGIRGIILKDTPIEMFTKCVAQVMAGKYCFCQKTVTSVANYLSGLKRHVDSEVEGTVRFTLREWEIISATLAGKTNGEIGANLSLGKQTVKHHLSNIFAKAGVSSRLELAVWVTSQRSS